MTADLRRKMERIARESFGFEGLSAEQRRAITALAEGRDTLAVMPTGSGKSAIYQIAGLLLPGPTVIISPLLALQRDQVASMRERDAGEADTLNSQRTEGERQDALEGFAEGGTDFLFMAPEQFSNPEVLERVRDARPSLFVVDEAHCISDWGEDFRPDYLRLGAVVEEIGRPAVAALTATASPRVREEIVERLHLRDPEIIVAGFDRPNIWLGVEGFHDETVKRRELLDRVVDEPKPGIVYVSTRAHAEELAAELAERGISAAAYHAGMRAADRRAAESDFMEGRVDVMVATNAFGMGIDKADVRFVFHFDIPDSIDTYYQEIGRAGRDGEEARAVLFYRPEDLNIHRFFAGGGQVTEEQVEEVVEVLEAHDEPLSPEEVQEETDLSRAKVTTALTRLEDAGALEVLPTGEVVSDPDGRVGEDIAQEAVEIESRRRQVDRSQIEMMRSYAELGGCRRTFILNYFGEPREEPCGNCDNCDAGVVPETSNEPFPLNTRVRHVTLGEGVIQRYEGDTMTVLFDEVGYKTLLTEMILEDGALERA